MSIDKVIKKITDSDMNDSEKILNLLTAFIKYQIKFNDTINKRIQYIEDSIDIEWEDDSIEDENILNNFSILKNVYDYDSKEYKIMEYFESRLGTTLEFNPENVSAIATDAAKRFNLDTAIIRKLILDASESI